MDELTKQEKATAVKNWLGKAVLYPEVTKDTLGEEYTSINPQMLLLASKKLIRINRQEIPPDDRDNLRYSTFLGIEDLVKEHIDKDAGRIQRKAAIKMQQKKNLSWLNSGFFTPQIKSVVIGNSLANNVEGINPLEIYDNAHRVTKLGEGAISSTVAVPEEARQVSQSSFGFIDPVHISESEKIGVTGFITHGVAKGKDRKLYKLVKDPKGNLVWKSHEELLNSKVALPGS